MFVVVNKYILARRFDGVTLWPFLFIRHRELKKNKVFMNHERIHMKQQLELLLVPFFIWYLAEYVIRLIMYRDSFKAYSKISFEREAYANEKDRNYIQKRKPWNFLRYF